MIPKLPWTAKSVSPYLSLPSPKLGIQVFDFALVRENAQRQPGPCAD